MRPLLTLLCSSAFAGAAQEPGSRPDLPALTAADRARPAADWLLGTVPQKARVLRGEHPGELVLTNGLIARTFRTTPDLATVALDNLMTGQSELRSVRPEGELVLDGRRCAVGGLDGAPAHNYLAPAWLEGMKASSDAFRLAGWSVGTTQARFPWQRRAAWLSCDPAWPPPGVSLTFELRATQDALAGITVRVHYELFDGIPVLGKWLTVHNGSTRAVRLDGFTAEILATVETGSSVDGAMGPGFLHEQRSLQVETDMAFGGMTDVACDNPAVRWGPDPRYESQVHYEKQTPCLLTCTPPLGPGVAIAPDETFATFRVFELLHDSTDRERRGLAMRRMYRVLAPWTQENPLMLHALPADPASVRRAIDQCAEVGFELVILSFGSGLDMESRDPKYLASIKDLVGYAHQRGIALGGYSLLASRSVDAATDVVSPATGKPGGFARFGNSPCLMSAWGEDYFRKVRSFLDTTGFDLLEHDGSYPGDACASTQHPGHAGHADSQWRQWRRIADFYQECRGKGVFLNVPDWYFLNGSNKTGMGYRETNWSLPRALQEVIERQNVFDGTWTKTPSMGWMFVPLVQYHGGGEAATIEPLHEHLGHYQRRFQNLLGAGVQACWRGPRLYDTDAVREMVKTEVAWFKHYRSILESDVVHGRRPDGRDLDWLLHVNPRLKAKGMLVVHNPLEVDAQRTLSVDLYYTGLTEVARVRERGGDGEELRLDRRFRVELPVTVPARGWNWFVVE